MKIRGQHSRGFTLIIGLVMAALAAILVIGLLVSASSDRLTAVSYDERFQAELAAQSGLEAAKEALNALPPNPVSGSKPRTRNDDFIVVASPDTNGTACPYFFIGCAEDPADTGTTDYTNPQIRYYPLFSGGSTLTAQTISAGIAPTPTPPTAPSPVAIQPNGSGYPKLFSSPAPHANWQSNIRTQWQYLPTPTPSPSPAAGPRQYRYTYWIEDLAGYVDANVAGNNWNPSGSTHWRPVGYAADEVALFTLFNSALPTDDGSTYAKSLVAASGTNAAYHPLLFTRMSTRLNTTSNSNDDLVCQKWLVANLQTDAEQTIIPFGMGYKNQGSLKTNLNQLLTDVANGERSADAAIDGTVPPPASPTPAASPIVPTITDNLPNFASKRQGGLASPEGYAETIAANILSYGRTITSPSSPPLVATNLVTGKHYRAVDLMPFATEVYEMFYWDNGYYQKTAGGDYYVDIRVRTYVNFWNMFAHDIKSGSLTFNDKLAAGIQFGTGGAISNFDTTKISNDSKIALDFSNLPNPPSGRGPNLVANEYRPLLACERVYTFDAGATAPIDNKIYIGGQGTPSSSGDLSSSYEISWNGVVYDKPGTLTTKALNRGDFNITKGTSPLEIIGTVPGLSAGYVTESSPYNLGDPRGSYYLQYTQWDRAYVGNSCWGGRVYLKALAGGSSPYFAAETRIPGWADGGHSSTQGVIPTSTPSVASTSPLKFTGEPTSLNGMPALEPSKAPARVAGTGRINSATELSYVYDPFQWDPFSSTPTSTTDVDNSWQNTWKNAFKNFPTAKSGDDNMYGSHSTLRIGRPEHKSFDTDGTRAWQLLDIFSVGDSANTNASGATTNQISTRGKINLNTASSEVLRTLGAGIQMGNLNSGDVDQAIQPAAVYGPQTNAAADSFASAVIAQRQKQPFISTSQLAAVPGSNSEPFFGNTDQWSSSDPNKPTEWNDAAAEQYFGKIYNLTTVRSRNFRVFVTGQYINPNPPYSAANPQVIATANKVYEVFLKPTRDANGAITDQACVITYQGDVQ